MSTQEEILRKLEIIAQLLAMNIFKDEPANQQIAKLHDLGFKNKEIEVILGKTENTVKATLSQQKSKKHGTKKGNSKDE